jgi:hypothetical protein
MAACDKNLDAAIQANFSGSENGKQVALANLSA